MGVSEGTASNGSSSREIDLKYDNRNFRQKKRAIERNCFPSLGDQHYPEILTQKHSVSGREKCPVIVENDLSAS